MKKYLLVITGICAAVWGYLGYASITFGNPSYQPITCKTASATTTWKNMTAGTATTTLPCDAYNLNATYVDPTMIDSAVLAIQLSASSTGTVLNINFEYSNDGIDWYGSNLNFVASTTAPLIGTVESFSWTYASSTIGGAGMVSTATTSYRILTVQTPTRYIRAIMSLAIGSKNGAVWAEFIPRKEMK